MKKILIFIFVCITNHSIAQSFSEKTSNGFIFAGEENSAAAFVDVDNEGDEDLLYFNIFYKNNDEEGFSSFFTFVGASNVIAFADYNGDGFADILFGNTLYRNNAGTGFTAIHTFTETPNAISFADFNNDILSDILLTGSTSSVLYRNNNGAFTQEQTLSGGTNSTYGDIDSDGDMDIIISKNTPPYSIIYENRNTGFVSVFENILTRTTTGTPNLIDFDADGDMDVFFSNVLYKNNEIGFSGISKITISNLSNYHSSWADVDNNGFADLVISGTENNLPTLTIYKNNRTSFAAITSIPNITKHTLTDVDSDADMDLFFSETGRFYENKTNVRNNPPNIPQGLDATLLENGEVLFSWSTVSDAETPSSGISYTLVITQEESSHSFGGTTTHANSVSRTLLPGLYYWSVRAIDAGNATSKSITKIYVHIHNYPITDIGSNGFTASWSRVPQASIYEVQVSETENFTSYQSYKTTDITYQVKNLSASRTYFIRILPVIIGIQENYSNTLSAITLSSYTESYRDTIAYANYGTTNFGDYDNDKDLDIFLNGDAAYIYKNNNTKYNKIIENPGVYYNSATTKDFNNDGTLDWFYTGRSENPWSLFGFLYYGNKSSFYENTSHNIQSQEHLVTAAGDYDNDGDIDIFVGGTAAPILYRNDGTAGFSTPFPDTTFISTGYGSAAFGDYDNDADLDLLLGGYSQTILYENNGTAGFSPAWTYPRTSNHTASFADNDNDGFLDIIISHQGINPTPIEIDTTTLAFRPNSNIFVFNNGDWQQTSSIPSNISYYYYYYPSYSYYNNFLYSNLLFYNNGIVFKNDGRKEFVKNTSLPSGNRYGSTSSADYNNDGRKDIYQMGSTNSLRTSQKTKDEKICIEGSYRSSDGTQYYYGTACVFAKSNYSIITTNTTHSSALLENAGDDFSITNTTQANLSTGENSTFNAFGDIDKDGDLDIMLPSRAGTKIYINNSAIKNTPPQQISTLTALVYGAGKVAFVWQNSQDAQLADSLSRKAHNGIDYNMYFGTTANKNSIRSAESHLDDGYRKISERGMIQGNIYKLENIPNGSYVWSIQAIDQGLTGGAWGIEQTIQVQNRAFSQSITFHSLAEKTFGYASFTIDATATSGLPVSFFSTNPNVANVIGNTVNIVGAGEANIIAIQTGNSQYYAAYPVQQLLKIKKLSQTITFQVIPTQTIGVPFVLNASSNFLLPVQFSLPNSNYTFLQSNTVTIYQSGTFTVTAFQNGNLDTNPALPVSQVVTVKAHQTISFFKISEKTYSDLPFVLQSRNSSSLAVSYSSASTKVTIDSSIIGINAVGTAAIVAFSNGSNNFFPTHTTQILTIKKARQSITFHPLSVRTLGHADSIVVLTPSASSSLPISLRVSGRSVVVNANTLTVKRAGVVLIEALQSGNENYEAASTVKYLTIIDPSKRNQTITFANIPNDTLHSEGDSVRIMLTASASSSLPLQFVVENSNDSLSAPSYRITTYGTYTITALQDGDSAFNPAPPVSRTFTVKRKQSIIFNPIPQKNYESTPFFISPYSLSGLEMQVSLSNDSVVSIAPDNLVTIQKIGTVSLSAKQRGNDEYYATDSITRILVVTKADQYFVFKPILSKIYEDPPILLPATTNAGLNIMYSSASNLIRIEGDTLKIIAGGGLVRITAYNTGNKFYNTLAPVSRIFSISKAQQSISFPQIENKVYSDAPLVLDSLSNKNRPITYTSSNENVLRIAENTASILRAGSTTLSATVPENSQYFGVSQTQTVLIAPAPQVVTFSEFPIVYLQDTSFVLNARSTNTLPITYSSSNPNIAYITGNTVFFQAFGNVFITASQPAVENYYKESNTARQLLTIKDITALDNEIPYNFTGISYVGDTTRVPRTYYGIPIFFEITKNTNGNGKTIAFFDEENGWIIYLDTGKLEVKIYTQPVINRTQRINPAVVKITITVKITYNIAGRVLGADNEVISGFVLLTNPTLRESIRAELSNGYFSIENVPEDWTFYLQAFPKGASVTSYYPTYYGSKQAIVWRYADTVTLTSHRTNFNWKLRPKHQTSTLTGNGTIIGKVILDTTKNQNHILYGNFFGRGIPYPYAHIFLKNTADSVLSSDISRTNGEFYFTKLPADYYRIAVDVPGTQMKNLNDTLFLPNEKNTLYLTIIIRKDNTIELIRNIEKLPQTIHFSPVYKYYGDEPFPIAATATSGLPLTFRSSSSLISITENIATIYGAGTSIITAFQSGNEYYSPSNPTSQVMAVEKAYQSITIQTNIINDTYTFSERRVIIKATASSGLPVQLTPSEPTITNRGDTFFVRGIASFKMTAFQKGNENYYAEQIFQDMIIDPNAIAVENPFITIFPNPADDYITIQWDKSQKVSSVKVYDIKGNVVSDGVWGIGYGVSIDIKTMPKGEYIVVVYGEKGEILKAEKVIKN